jgi:hypothetical protein
VVVACALLASNNYQAARRLVDTVVAPSIAGAIPGLPAVPTLLTEQLVPQLALPPMPAVPAVTVSQMMLPPVSAAPKVVVPLPPMPVVPFVCPS